MLELAYADSVQVTRGDRHTFAGTSHRTYAYTVSQYGGAYSIPALCGEPWKDTPIYKNENPKWLEVAGESWNDYVRHCLYYSCAGPGGLNGGGAYSGDYIVSALLVGYAYGTEPASISGGAQYNQAVMDAYNYAMNHSVPSGYHVYQTAAPSNHDGQRLFFGILSEGGIRVYKTGSGSAALGLSSGGVSGVRFGVYSDAACTSSVGELTTDSSGYAEMGSLGEGTYWIKELYAPWPYTVPEGGNVQSVRVVPGETASASFNDSPAPPTRVHKTQVPASSTYTMSSTAYGAGGRVSATAVLDNHVADGGDLTIQYTVKFDSYGGPATFQLPSPIEWDGGDAGASYGNGAVTVTGSTGGSVTFNGKVRSGHGWDIGASTATLLSIGSNGVISAPLSGVSAAGVTYGIYSDASCTNYVGTVTIGADGTGMFGASSGQSLQPSTMYYLKERGGANGYDPDPNIRHFTTSSDGTVSDVWVSDSTTPTYFVKKSSNPEMTDGDSRYSLAGAQFAFFASMEEAEEGNHPVRTVTTDADGRGSITGLNIGATYYVKEIKAPEGFAEVGKGSDDKIVPLTIKQGQANELSFEDKPNVRITPRKVSSKSIALALPQYSLGNARIAVYDSEGKANATYANAAAASDAAVVVFSTDADGTCDGISLPMKDYWVREIAEPSAFKPNSSVYHISESDFERDTDYHIDIPDEPKTMSLSIKKAGDGISADVAMASGSKYSLAGAVIGVYRTYSDAVNKVNPVTTVTTRADGSCDEITGLDPAARYYVREIKKPDSDVYKINDSIFTADYANDNTLSEDVTITDSLIPVKITIRKTVRDGAVTNSLYSFKGTKFGVYKTKEAADAATGANPGTAESGLVETLTIDDGATTEVSTSALLPFQPYYYVKELEANKSFRINGNVFTVDNTDNAGAGGGLTTVAVSNGMISSSITIDNEPEYCYVKVKKTGGAADLSNPNYSLENAVFGLYKTREEADNAGPDNLGSPLYVLRTENINGTYYAVSGLLAHGTYYLKEIEAPKGFSPSTQTYPVESYPGPKPGASTPTTPYDNSTVTNERSALESSSGVKRSNVDRAWGNDDAQDESSGILSDSVALNGNGDDSDAENTSMFMSENENADDDSINNAGNMLPELAKSSLIDESDIPGNLEIARAPFRAAGSVGMVWDDDYDIMTPTQRRTPVSYLSGLYVIKPHNGSTLLTADKNNNCVRMQSIKSYSNRDQQWYFEPETQLTAKTNGSYDDSSETTENRLCYITSASDNSVIKRNGTGQDTNMSLSLTRKYSKPYSLDLPWFLISNTSDDSWGFVPWAWWDSFDNWYSGAAYPKSPYWGTSGTYRGFYKDEKQHSRYYAIDYSSNPVRLANREGDGNNPGDGWTGTGGTRQFDIIRARHGIVYDPEGGIVSGTYDKIQTQEVYLQKNGGLSTSRISVTSPTRSGYRFDGWYTSAYGGSYISSLSNISDINVAEGVTTLHAHWVRDTDTIYYYGNGGTRSGSSSYTDTVDDGSSYYVDNNTFNRTGYTFDEWNTRSNGNGTSYNANEYIQSVTSNMSLYAQWTPNTWYIRYNGNDARTGSMPNQSVTYGTGNVSLLSNAFKRPGYDFVGWNTSSDGSGNTYTDTGSVSRSLKSASGDYLDLYAQWKINNDHSIDWSQIPLSATVDDVPNVTGFTITKKVSAGAPQSLGYSLAGAVFGVYTSKSAADVATYDNPGSPAFALSRTTTDEFGRVALTDLAVGTTYYVKELKAPSGFSLNTGTYNLTTTRNVMQNVDVEDAPETVSISIVKRASMNGAEDAPDWYVASHPLKAKFGVYETEADAEAATAESAGSPIAVLETDATGKASASGLLKKQDAYYIKELIAPPGYDAESGVVEAKCGDGAQRSGYIEYSATGSVIDNVPTGGIAVSKDSSNPELLEKIGGSLDATYGVYSSRADASGNVNMIASIKLDKSGAGQVSGLPYGTYYVKETERPVGCGMDSEIHEVSVTGGGAATVSAHLSVTDTLDSLTIAVRKKATGTEGFINSISIAGAEYSVYKDEACTELATDEKLITDDKGDTNTVILLAGMYYVKETKAPSPYFKLDDNIYPVSGANGTIESVDAVRDDVKCTITVKKESNNPDYLNGDLSGARFSVYTDAECLHKAGDMVTDKDGSASLTGLFPGTYYVRETKALNGHTPNSKVYDVTVDEEHRTGVVEDEPGSGTVVNYTGSLRVVKHGTESELINGLSSYSLTGAVYGVYGNKDCSGGRIALLNIGDDGKSNIVSGLRTGTYYVKEEKAPDGYKIDSDIHSVSVDATTNGADNPAVIDSTDTPILSAPPAIAKVSAETGNGTEIGAGTLSGAEFEVRYYDSDAAHISEDAAPTRKWTVRTDESGYTALDDKHIVSGDQLYKDSNGNVVLPIGALTIRETKAPNGYIVSDAETRTFELSERGAIEVGGNQTIPVTTTTFQDDIKRGSLRIQKKDSNGGSMANVPFLITLLDDADGDGKYETPVESHVMFTDANGVIDTETVKHSQSTNANDNLYNGDYSNVRSYGAKIGGSASPAICGVWFSGFNGANTVSKIDDSRGALPYGHYSIDEIHSDANTGYSLTYSNEVDVDEDKKSLEISAVNHKIRIDNTTAREKSNNLKQADGSLDHKVITDTVTYSDAVVGEVYTVYSYAYDKSSGTVLTLDSDGFKDEYFGSQTFTATSTSGSLDIDVDLAGLNWESGDIAIVTEIQRENGEIASTHNDDLTDANEIVSYRRISSTLAVDAGTGKHYADAESDDGAHKVKDTITYENLVPGTTYKAVGELHIKNYENGTYTDGGVFKDKDGNSITVEKEFTPQSPNGSVDIEYEADQDDDWNGATVVSFASVEDENGGVICSHDDIGSEDQTVRYVRVRTKALDDKTHAHSGKYEDDMSFTDTVKYWSLIPGETYTMTSTLMDSKTGEPVKNENGQFVSVTRSFTPDSPDGEIEMQSKMSDMSASSVRDCVVYETISANGEIVGAHQQPDDGDQSIRYGEVKLPFTGNIGIIGVLIAWLTGMAWCAVRIVRDAKRDKRDKNDDDDGER